MAVLNALQLSCLGSSVRAEIFEAIAVLPEASIAEVAAIIDRPALSLYYHFDKLLEAGLIVACGTRDAHTQTETLYRAISARVQLDKRDRSPAYRNAQKKLLRTALSRAQKQFDRAQESEVEDPTQLLRVTARLNPAQAAEFRRKMVELGAWLRAQDGADGERHTITAVFTPAA